KTGVVSKSSAAALATVIAPVAGLIANAPPVLPPVMLYVSESPSTSEPVTAPTAVAFGEFSGNENVAWASVGASFTGATVRLTVATPESAVPSLTLNANDAGPL